MEMVLPAKDVNDLNKADGFEPAASIDLKATPGDRDRSLELAGSDFLLGC
jgi:hypothetical protein